MTHASEPSNKKGNKTETCKIKYEALKYSHDALIFYLHFFAETSCFEKKNFVWFGG